LGERDSRRHVDRGRDGASAFPESTRPDLVGAEVSACPPVDASFPLISKVPASPVGRAKRKSASATDDRDRTLASSPSASEGHCDASLR
jgi:hypothetical protein